MAVKRVLSQRNYPGAGDIDDCWVVATVWAAISSRDVRKPTVTEFRARAGKPDRPGPTGGNVYDCNRGADGCWPTLPNRLFGVGSSWTAVYNDLHSGRPASVGVLSSALPARLQYGFKGTHQVGIHFFPATGKLYCMNPLAPHGTVPLTITWIQLRAAMRALIPGSATPYRMLSFPIPR